MIYCFVKLFEDSNYFALIWRFFQNPGNMCILSYTNVILLSGTRSDFDIEKFRFCSLFTLIFSNRNHRFSVLFCYYQFDVFFALL